MFSQSIRALDTIYRIHHSGQAFLSKTLANSLNMQKQYEKNIWEKSDDAYSLTIRVQTALNQI